MDYFDCHADTLTEIPATENLWQNSCDLDLKRIQQFAGHYAQIFAIWKDLKKISGPQLPEVFLQAYNRAVGLLNEQRELITWCQSAEDMRKARQNGRAAAFLSVEDVSVMGPLAERIRELGICFAMLTWNYENCYGCGAAADQSKGLTEEGRRLVRQLHRQQLVVDISHLSDQGTDDVFSETDRPVMASHSNVREVQNHPRNLQTAHIRELIRRKGLMGLNFYGPFVKDHPAKEDLLRHVDAVLNLGGEDILAIGGDFDGCGQNFPEGITDVSSIPHIRHMLEREGVAPAVTEKLFYGNAWRFLLENL